MALHTVGREDAVEAVAARLRQRRVAVHLTIVGVADGLSSRLYTKLVIFDLGGGGRGWWWPSWWVGGGEINCEGPWKVKLRQTQ